MTEYVTVIGAGVMGHGIAEVCAIAGYDVTLRDVDGEVLNDGYDQIEWSLEKLTEANRLTESPEIILERIEVTTDLEAAVAPADLVIEAIPEVLDLKRSVFSEVERIVDAETILATNTSSLPVTDIQAALERPEHLVGLHFFNPPVKMDLVEVVFGEQTDDAVADTAYAFVESLDKTPIYVRKDVRGFVVNTVLGPFISEPAWMVSEGDARIKQADAAMVYERGYPMGPFELNDLTGLDVGYSIREEAAQPIPPIMQERYEAGDYGRKTGKGYYDYEDGDGPAYAPDDAEGFDTLRVEARMVNRAAYLVGEEVATPEDVDIGVRLGLGFPEGICRRGDRLGLGVILEKLETLYETTGAERYEPHPYLIELVEAGHTGETAGHGFYEYDDVGTNEAYHYLEVALNDGVLSITLDRPERLNALSGELFEELAAALEHAPLDEVRCVTIQGRGDRAFSAGADITTFGDLQPAALPTTSTQTIETVADFPRPVVAVIDGYCLGAGLELALACDMRIATTRSTFGFPEIDLGLVPGLGGSQRAMRLLGETRAKELVYRGAHIDADTAADWGLISRAVDLETFDDAVKELIDDLRTGPPLALAAAKRVMDEGADGPLDAGLALEREAFGLLLTTDDVAEGTAAFAEDREPTFEGH